MIIRNFILVLSCVFFVLAVISLYLCQIHVNIQLHLHHVIPNTVYLIDIAIPGDSELQKQVDVLASKNQALDKFI